MSRSIVPKFSDGNLGGPFSRAGINEATKKGFHLLVEALDLSIRLRVVTGAHLKGNNSKAKQFLLEDTGEDTITV